MKFKCRNATCGIAGKLLAVLMVLLLVTGMCACTDKDKSDVNAHVSGDIFFRGVKTGDNIFEIEDHITQIGRYNAFVGDDEVERPLYGGAFDDPVTLDDGCKMYTSVQIRNDLITSLDTEICPPSDPGTDKDAVFEKYMKAFTEEFGLDINKALRYESEDDIRNIISYSFEPADRSVGEYVREVLSEEYYLWEDPSGVYYGVCDMTYHYKELESSETRRFVFCTTVSYKDEM